MLTGNRRRKNDKEAAANRPPGEDMGSAGEGRLRSAPSGLFGLTPAASSGRPRLESGEAGRRARRRAGEADRPAPSRPVPDPAGMVGCSTRVFRARPRTDRRSPLATKRRGGASTRMSGGCGPAAGRGRTVNGRRMRDGRHSGPRIPSPVGAVRMKPGCLAVVDQQLCPISPFRSVLRPSAVGVLRVGWGFGADTRRDDRDARCDPAHATAQWWVRTAAPRALVARKTGRASNVRWPRYRPVLVGVWWNLPHFARSHLVSRLYIL